MAMKIKGTGGGMKLKGTGGGLKSKPLASIGGGGGGGGLMAAGGPLNPYVIATDGTVNDFVMDGTVDTLWYPKGVPGIWVGVDERNTVKGAKYFTFTAPSLSAGQAIRIRLGSPTYSGNVDTFLGFFSGASLADVSQVIMWNHDTDGYWLGSDASSTLLVPPYMVVAGNNYIVEATTRNWYQDPVAAQIVVDVVNDTPVAPELSSSYPLICYSIYYPNFNFVSMANTLVGGLESISMTNPNVIVFVETGLKSTLASHLFRVSFDGGLNWTASANDPAIGINGPSFWGNGWCVNLGNVVKPGGGTLGAGDVGSSVTMDVQWSPDGTTWNNLITGQSINIVA